MQPKQPYFSGFVPLSAESAAELMADARPQYLQPDQPTDTVVICVHGFTGTPYEVAPAAKELANRGIAAVVPLLPGHGYQDRQDQEREFAQLTPAGMLSAMRQEIAQARERYGRVGMLGFSMGGAIALSIAAEGLLDACVVVAPALRLSRKAEILIPLLSWASFTLEAPSQEPFYLPGYEFYHSRALRALWQLGRYAQQQLPEIRCPILGIHSHNDQTIPPIVLAAMEKQIPRQIETAWFDNSDHVMLLDASGPAVAATIADFFQRQLSSQPL